MKPAAARALLLGLALGGAGCGEPAGVVQGAGSGGPRADPGPQDPAEFGALPDFRLVSEAGREVTLESLRGRPLVLGALFSTCTGPCPSIARGLAGLQEGLAETDALIAVVSVDPATDTPAVLARYAERWDADPERWIFLTGEESQVWRFVREGLLLSVGQDGEGEVTHDTRLLAVDRRGQRRGWYPGTDELGIERLRRRMLHLASEPGQGR